MHLGFEAKHDGDCLLHTRGCCLTTMVTQRQPCNFAQGWTGHHAFTLPISDFMEYIPKSVDYSSMVICHTAICDAALPRHFEDKPEADGAL